MADIKSLIINPETGLPKSAEDLMDELWKWCKERDMALIANGETFVLCKCEGSRTRAIAEIQKIMPGEYFYRAMNWSKALKQ